MAWYRKRASRSGEDHADEMRAHVDLLADQLMAQGRTPDQARREARLKFGNPRVKLEEIRDRRSALGVDVLRADVRTAARGLRATPGFTAVMLIVLTLTMSAVTAVVALVDGVMLRPLPFERADQLVTFGREYKGRLSPTIFTPGEFLGLSTRESVFSSVAAVTNTDVTLRRETDHPAEILRAQRATASLFDVLRARPALGRAFETDNEVDGRDRVAVISHGLWQRRFGGRPDIIGQKLPASSGAIEVLGVMAPGFEYPVSVSRPTELWVPYVLPASERTGHSHVYLQLVARLREGVTLQAAAAAGLTEAARAAEGAVEWQPSEPIVPIDLQQSDSLAVRD